MNGHHGQVFEEQTRRSSMLPLQDAVLKLCNVTALTMADTKRSIELLVPGTKEEGAQLIRSCNLGAPVLEGLEIAGLILF